MNKFILGIVVVAVLAVSLGIAGFAYAQTPTPATPVPGTGYGSGMMGGRGPRGGMMGANAAGTQTGFLHDDMVAAFAEKLGLSVDELNTRLANGETMAQIAASEGQTADQFRTLMSEVRSQAIDQAVKDGELTQQQAEWMKQRGSGHGWFANQGCPYYTSTTP